VRRLAGADCCACGKAADACCAELVHAHSGVVELTGTRRWICAECTRTANAEWSRAARLASGAK
jgi:hypothetical protein